MSPRNKISVCILENFAHMLIMFDFIYASYEYLKHIFRVVGGQNLEE